MATVGLVGLEQRIQQTFNDLCTPSLDELLKIASPHEYVKCTPFSKKEPAYQAAVLVPHAKGSTPYTFVVQSIPTIRLRLIRGVYTQDIQEGCDEINTYYDRRIDVLYHKICQANQNTKARRQSA